MTSSTDAFFDIASVLERLRTSPIFAMSLGSKELFHTNLLVFLLECEEPQMAPVQAALRDVIGLPVSTGAGDLGRCAVWRELANLDLVIVPLVKANGEVTLASDRCVVVEAKLKAIPSFQQLEKYSVREGVLKLSRQAFRGSVMFRLAADEAALPKAQLAPPARLVLLTLDASASPHPGWRTIGWADLNAALLSSVAQLAVDTPHRHIWAEYSATLKCVIRIAQFANALPEAMRQDDALFGGFYKELMSTRWSALRIHDLVGKCAYAAWGASLVHQAGKEVTNSTVEPAAPCEIMLSRGQAGLTVEFPYREFTIGVQVQGCELRRFVRSARPAPELEQFVVESGAVGDWVKRTECGRSLLGTARGAVAWLARDDGLGAGRATNLRIFDVQRFVYGFLPLAGERFLTVERLVRESLESAARLSRSVE